MPAGRKRGNGYRKGGRENGKKTLKITPHHSSA